MVKEVDDLEQSVPTDLDDLSDVEITEPSGGQILSFDGTTSKWINTNGGSGGSGISIGTTESKIGSFGGADWFAISYPLTSISNQGTVELTGIPAGSTIIAAFGGVVESGVFRPLPYVTNVSGVGNIGFDITYSTDKWLASWRCPNAHATLTGNIIVTYTKPAENNTRKRGK